MMAQKFLFISMLLFITSCASKPVLYPNKKLKMVGKEKGNEDIEHCLAEADEYLESPQAKKILKGAGKGSFVGAAVGAVSGLITGDVLKGAASGAALGGAAGAAGAAVSPDRLKRAFVNKCLKDKGYKVLGWD